MTLVPLQSTELARNTSLSPLQQMIEDAHVPWKMLSTFKGLMPDNIKDTFSFLMNVKDDPYKLNILVRGIIDKMQEKLTEDNNAGYGKKE